MTVFTLFNTIVLMGSVQGFILCGLLFTSTKNKRSNRFLAFIMLIFGMACFNLLLDGLPLHEYFPWIDFLLNFIPLIVVMPVGPLVYFYIQSNLDPTFRLKKKHRWHFVPVIVDFGAPLIAITFLIGLISGFVKNDPQLWGLLIDNYNVYSDIPRWFSVTLYLGLSYRYLNAHATQNQQRKWFRQFIHIFLAFQFIWLLYLIPYVIPSLTDLVLNTVDWYPVYIPLVVLIYSLGIKGYLLPAQESPTPKRATVLPPLDTVNEVMPLLERAMEKDELYLNPELNLALLSQHTGIASKTISSVLNQYMQKSFNEYVNGYRIAAFKQKVLKPDFEHLTIMGIAFESGFNSQATFQRAFKQTIGMSPKEYLTEFKRKKSDQSA